MAKKEKATKVEKEEVKTVGHDSLYPYPTDAGEAASLLLKKLAGEETDLSCCVHAGWQLQGFALGTMLPDTDSEPPVMKSAKCPSVDDLDNAECKRILSTVAKTSDHGDMKAIDPETWQMVFTVVLKLLSDWLTKKS